MQKVIKKSVFTCIIISAVLSQSLIYDSGLCFMRKVRQVCICNHNSKKEAHFKSYAKSDCHDINKAVHICSCKKTKNPNELSNLLKQTFTLPSYNFSNFTIQLTQHIFPISNLISNLKGYQLTLIKPPRFS